MYPELFSSILNRRPDSHKYDYGHVLVVGGSPGMVGAPLLAGRAALRTGAGLVTIAAPAGVAAKLEKRVEELMTLALPADGNAAADEIMDFSTRRKASVLVLGPGLAASPAHKTLIKNLLKVVELPIVIDAGALNVLQDHLEWLDNAASRELILTPHAGEFQRLTGERPPAAGQSALKPAAGEFAAAHDVILVLKGQPTYVAAHRSTGIYENSTGNPGLATAGTGDVLSGVIAGLLAQFTKRTASVSSVKIVESGVYLHGLAGDIAAGEKTEAGMIAGDVIEAIPAALKRIANV